tara:strand:- start:2573 stop:2992 length:420 start_codon:yes stop_codon:yes gene_type:complete
VKKKESIPKKDQQIWDEYLKNPKDIFDKEIKETTNSKGNKRYRFDLHGFTLIEANSKIKEVITNCIKNNYNEILLITGKGIHSNSDKDIYVSKDLSKLRYSIPEYLNSENELSKNILSINVAGESDGGEGALIIKLRKL